MMSKDGFLIANSATLRKAIERKITEIEPHLADERARKEAIRQEYDEELDRRRAARESKVAEYEKQYSAWVSLPRWRKWFTPEPDDSALYSLSPFGYMPVDGRWANIHYRLTSLRDALVPGTVHLPLLDAMALKLGAKEDTPDA